MTNYSEEYVQINGIEQYFLHLPRDSENVVIMLHGGPGLANSYLGYFVEPYTDFCNMVFYDQRGSGKTQIKNKSTAESLTLSNLLQDLKETVSYVKSKYKTNKIFLLGHSWGSMLGTQYILTYPNYPNDVAGYIGYGQGVPSKEQDRHYYEFVKTAVMKSGNNDHIDTINKVSANFPNVPREDYSWQYNIIAGLGFGCGYDFTVGDVFEIYANSPTWTPDDETIAEVVEKLNEKLYAEVLYDWNVDTFEYSVPVYYVLGRHDKMTASSISANYFEKVQAPKKSLYWIEDAGHLVDTDNPKAFFSVIKEIVTEQIHL